MPWLLKALEHCLVDCKTIEKLEGSMKSDYLKGTITELTTFMIGNHHGHGLKQKCANTKHK